MISLETPSDMNSKSDTGLENFEKFRFLRSQNILKFFEISGHCQKCKNCKKIVKIVKKNNLFLLQDC